jgi:hypothetical protein
VLKSATNAGKGYGGMQALEEAYPVVADYDLVVHLHPDVLIYDCEALEARPRPWVFLALRRVSLSVLRRAKNAPNCRIVKLCGRARLRGMAESAERGDAA